MATKTKSAKVLRSNTVATIELTMTKETKNCYRFDVPEEGTAKRNFGYLYMNKEQFTNGEPKSIRIEVTEV